MIKSFSFLLILVLCGACNWGVPTRYEQSFAEQKRPCIGHCKKAHPSADKPGYARCLQVCEAKLEMQRRQPRVKGVANRPKEN